MLYVSNSMLRTSIDVTITAAVSIPDPTVVSVWRIVGNASFVLCYHAMPLLDKDCQRGQGAVKILKLIPNNAQD